MGKDCQRCHNENNWVNNVIFDHDLSSFPLAGLHALIPCEQCHISRPFKHIDSSCVDCHRSDDKHEQTQGEHCANCHTPNGWSLWNFDHNSKTDFLLDGKHNDLACSACHKKPVRKKASAPQICGQCHIADDAHDGDFGKHCDRCHSTSEFSDIKRRH